MSSNVPSTSDIISICNAVVEISEVLEYSFPSLKSYNSTNQTIHKKDLNKSLKIQTIHKESNF